MVIPYIYIHQMNQLHFGLNLMGGAKAGKMVKARGGGMAMRMKPTKMY